MEPVGGPAPTDPPGGLSKRSRGAIVVVVLGALLVVGMIVSSRRRDDFDHAMTRVQVAAQATGGSIDPEAFKLARATELTGEWGGDEARPARAMIPVIPGAEIVNYQSVSNPTKVIVDYQVEAGGQDGCIRMTHDATGTEVRSARNVCATAFTGSP